MPPRTRVRLLVGFAVAACAGAVGCQTGSVRSGGFPPMLGAMPMTGDPAIASAPVAAPGTVIASSNPAGQPARPAATIGPALSVWQPVQRVTAAKPVAPADGVTRVSNPPSPGGPVPASLDVPQPDAVSATALPGEPVARRQPAYSAWSRSRSSSTRHPVISSDPGHPVVVDAPNLLPPPAPHEFAKQPLPPYVVEPPDILLVSLLKDLALPEQAVDGQHLVRPDGTISLGIYGNVYVAGLTLDEAADAVAAQLHELINKKSIEDIKKGLVVDVIAYNSKVYYVITDGGGYGEQVYPIPITGNETVLDALSKIGGLPPVASKNHIWVARATVDCCHPVLLPVDWCGITKRGCVATNYQIFPNDRIYVASDKWIQLESWLSKRLNPVDRVMGSVLLGASTVNQIKNKAASTGGGVP